MRSLKSQAGWCARLQWVLGLALITITVGFYILAYRPSDSQRRDLQKQIDAKQKQLASNQVEARRLRVVEAEVDKLKLRLERFNKSLPKHPELSKFVSDITLISNQVALRKLSWQPGLQRKSDSFSELPISLHFEGDFMSVFQFLRQTEEMQRLTRVKSISIKNRDPKLGQVEVQLSMNIYFVEG